MDVPALVAVEGEGDGLGVIAPAFAGGILGHGIGHIFHIELCGGGHGAVIVGIGEGAEAEKEGEDEYECGQRTFHVKYPFFLI